MADDGSSLRNVKDLRNFLKVFFFFAKLKLLQFSNQLRVIERAFHLIFVLFELVGIRFNFIEIQNMEKLEIRPPTHV